MSGGVPIISSYVTPPTKKGAPNMQEKHTARGWAEPCLSKALAHG